MRPNRLVFLNQTSSVVIIRLNMGNFEDTKQQTTFRKSQDLYSLYRFRYFYTSVLNAHKLSLQMFSKLDLLVGKHLEIIYLLKDLSIFL